MRSNLPNSMRHARHDDYRHRRRCQSEQTALEGKLRRTRKQIREVNESLAGYPRPRRERTLLTKREELLQEVRRLEAAKKRLAPPTSVIRTIPLAA
ncbi:hypothetical protein LRY29_00045 [Candidatus Saccharibacteria bacterium]|nr:hypothetical protein [Candidatus Saccharibacteria bacterium]